MAKQLLQDTAVLRFSIMEASEGGKLKARGEFARADIPTANKRVYPRKIWEQQLKRLQESIDQRKMLGELDHPCFIDNDFEVLSEEGWKRFEDIQIGEKVLSTEGRFSDVMDIINQEYSGLAVTISHDQITSGFTPAHKLVLVHEGQVTEKSIFGVSKNPEKYANYKIPLDIEMTEFVSVSDCEFSESQHDGRIYCLSVTHGNFFVRKEGKTFWTGNSDGKTKLTRASHLITSLEIAEDGQIIGEFEVIEGTPNGNTLKALIDSNCAVGVSSRGYGSVKMNEEGNDVVQEDFTLMTFDAVSDPACATSYPEFTTEQKEIKNLLKNSLSESAIADAKKMLLDYKIPFEDIIQRGKEIVVTFIKEQFAKKFAKLFSLYGGEKVSVEQASDKWNVHGVATMEESFVQVCEAWKEDEASAPMPVAESDEGTEYSDDAFLMHHVCYDFMGQPRKTPVKELNVDFPMDRLHELQEKDLVKIEKGLVTPTEKGKQLADTFKDSRTQKVTEQDMDIAARQSHISAIKKEVEQAKKQSPQDAKELENSMRDISKKWKINPDLIKTEAASPYNFTIVKNQKSQFGHWVRLATDKYTIEAKMFVEPSQDFGVDGSNISKLYIVNNDTKEEVYNYDRGLDFDESPSGLVASIIDFLKPGSDGYKEVFKEAKTESSNSFSGYSEYYRALKDYFTFPFRSEKQQEDHWEQLQAHKQKLIDSGNLTPDQAEEAEFEAREPSFREAKESEQSSREEWLKQEPKKTPNGTTLYPFWHPTLNKGTWVTIPDEDMEESHQPNATALEWAVEQVTPILKEKMLAEFSEAFQEKTRSVMDENRKLKEENFNLASISKELGFSLYLERNCASHPKFQQLKESLKGFKHVETIEELKNLCGPYIEESKEITRQQSIQHKMAIQKLESRVNELQERSQSLIEQNRNVSDQLHQSRLLAEGYENRFYLEKRLIGHPSAIEIQKLFEDRNPSSKEEVDKVVSVFRKKIETGPSLIESVQTALKRRRMPMNNLVENSILPTMPRENKAYIPESDITIPEFEKLAGIHSK